MSKYIFSKKAIEDLSEIWHYTLDTWSEKQADTYYKLLIGGCKYLTENQKVGKRYYEIFDGLRGYKVKHHIIFYFVSSEDNIEIIRILHERMDLPNHLK